MYKNKLKIVLTFLIALTFFSCDINNDLEEKYSCDKSIDTWVKKNRQKIQKMNAYEFQDYDNPHQRAIFSAMLPKQRVMLWEKHLSDILKLEWSDAEREHINELYLYVKDNHYIFKNNLTESERDKIEVYVYRWKNYAKKTFNWSDKTIFYMVANLQKVYKDGQSSELVTYREKLTKKHQRIKNKTRENNGTSTDCGCSSGSDWCFMKLPHWFKDGKFYYYECAGGCSYPASSGCGTLCNSPCDANCKLSYVQY